MKYPHGTARIAGVLIPVAALRSSYSVGCGEFADLTALAAWCSATGQKIIQLLPVNDTGSQSSPYSALSAFALHPIYVRITDLPEYRALQPAEKNAVDARISALRAAQEEAERFDYEAVLQEKLTILHIIYQATRETILTSSELSSFLRRNGWVKAYAVFRTLKDRYEQKPWTEWPEYRDIEPAMLDKLWKRATLKDETRFHAWLQMRAAEQFSAAAGQVEQAGIALKGDIPILMNEDSVDAWYDRDIFRPELRAGAPPDMFSQLGQNWGFPIYNWERLTERDFDWWRERLRHASQYYHAYRIDHVLGFFRIWTIPAGNWSGIPGFFWPQHGISREELHENGFDDSRIRWLLEPHLSGEDLRAHGGAALEGIRDSIVRQLPGEDLFLFAPEITGEQQLSDAGLSEDARDWLLDQWRDRALVELPDGRFAATWTFRACSRYQHLTEGEKDRFESLVAARGADSNELWADHGKRVLSVMKETTDMLPCAEDLGVVPDVVPRVLGQLEILGLMIPRWAHYWDRPGQPLIPLHDYPELTVCAPSVHDTSTMRGWWEQEDGRHELWHAIGMDEDCPESFTADTAERVYRAFLKSTSRIVVFQLQDLLVLAPETLHDDPHRERINVPGTYNEFNWTWRMPLTLEELANHAKLREQVAHLTAVRSN
ncbi:MAG: 4-alpha-glucanotransferase [Alkalispirochaeta sp.]